MNDTRYTEIRDAIRALCAEFPDAYHRQVDEGLGVAARGIDLPVVRVGEFGAQGADRVANVGVAGVVHAVCAVARIVSPPSWS